MIYRATSIWCGTRDEDLRNATFPHVIFNCISLEMDFFFNFLYLSIDISKSAFLVDFRMPLKNTNKRKMTE